MSIELDKAYDPSKYESAIYAKWEASGAFKPDPKAKKSPFTIIMPPPNANGDLHTGHAMFVIEDILTRYYRMQGHPTLWLPGTDHAGIETQVVYERELAKTGQTRFDLGRDDFYDAALAFTLKNQPNIIAQLRSLGFSADWSRLKFTLDPDIIQTVYATFKQMHDDGLVYRGNRIVNWCTSCQSSFADIEVKYEDRKDAMYTLDYGAVNIATTRPETIFADVAVAVHPDDERYAALIGQVATIPLIDRPIAIIGDTHVAREIGTGALKVSPAHSKDDYEIGKRHNLPEISVIDLNGTLINVPEEFAGLSVTDARAAVVTSLTAAGKLIETTPLTHSVGVHDRCGTVIEPLITEQWYMRVSAPNAKVIAAIEADDIKIIPERFKKTALDWLHNEYDWNIGRQNWFGIRIPVYYKLSSDFDKDPYIVAADEQAAIDYYGKGNYRAETDVFDTWYSSGQWPYATLMATGDFDRGFYPTSVMETGRDILTKWVTKMAMFSLYRTGRIPFHTVYLHGMINDEHGKKMSKSKGNVINPLAMTATYGTDALRLALTIGITPGNDGALSEAKIEGYRNFCNKLWNVARYILGQLPDDYSPAPPTLDSPADAWIFTRVQTAITDITEAIEGYRFSEAGETIYSLVWNDFADWYIEASKGDFNLDMLMYCLETILKLAHPIAPFVTEALWDALPWQSGQILTESWPNMQPYTHARDQAELFNDLRTLILAVRSLSAEEHLARPVVITTDERVTEHVALVRRLARSGEVRIVASGHGLYLGTARPAWIEATAEQIQARTARLEASRTEKMTYLKTLQAKLDNARFMASAPEAVVADTKARHEETLMLLSKLDEQLSAPSN